MVNVSPFPVRVGSSLFIQGGQVQARLAALKVHNADPAALEPAQCGLPRARPLHHRSGHRRFLSGTKGFHAFSCPDSQADVARACACTGAPHSGARPRTPCNPPRSPRLGNYQHPPMSTVAVPVIEDGAQFIDSKALAAVWGGGDKLARVFGEMRRCLADDTLPPLRAGVRALVTDVTWAHVADTMRIAGSSQWRGELKVSNSAMGHQMLWLLVGDDGSSPRQLGLQGGYHKGLQKALLTQISEPFDREVDTEARRAKKAAGKRGKYDLSAARATVARLPAWSAAADVEVLRALMTDPLGAAAALLAARSRVAAAGTLLAPLRPWVRVRPWPTHVVKWHSTVRDC